ncbi:hypothetical protein PPTG_12966 [Phytophthora nicotianae INRA-310]|uniref:Uncharacterized protein n=1 Tax=Phytophthora nicotianae (strain INRA-310) TaxID=761204 RepID=W2Q4Z2_PHYN3|nr:hypothetical protein PPTG_12966 [Phytophthora nicotianae INRA-310]ETN07624.1 hypothetical protein PPTG_12966 [Phytophthora nicotianae INRA-310]
MSSLVSHWIFAPVRTNRLKRNTLWRAQNTRWKSTGALHCFLSFKRFADTNQ